MESVHSSSVCENITGRFHIYVSCSSYGTFKGIELRKLPQVSEWKNLFPISTIDKTKKVITMNWRDDSDKEILQALESTDVQIYSTDTNQIVNTISTVRGKGAIRGLSEYQDKIITAFESGLVMLWNRREGSADKTEHIEFDTGKLLNVMRHCDDTIATGGYENDLCVWDLQTLRRIFHAKNVKPDHLQLRVPISICDIQFMRQSPKIVSCHKIGFVRIYEPKTQRRPVISWSVPDESFTCVAVTHNELGVIAGSSKGGMYLFDIRNTKKHASKFKGFSGCVTSVACHKTQPYIVSSSLDKHVRVHSLNTTALLQKIYTVSPGDSVLIKSNYSFDRVLQCSSADGVTGDDNASETNEDFEGCIDENDQLNEGLDWSDNTDGEAEDAVSKQKSSKSISIKDDVERDEKQKKKRRKCESVQPKKRRKKVRK